MLKKIITTLLHIPLQNYISKPYILEFIIKQHYYNLQGLLMLKETRIHFNVNGGRSTIGATKYINFSHIF